MALHDVWWRNPDSHEWERTTAKEANSRFDYFIASSGRMFRCHKCLHYVEFYPATPSRICFFKHSRGDENKDCEDRSDYQGANWLGKYDSTTLPIRLIIDNGNNFHLEVGMLPLKEAELDSIIGAHAFVEISSPHSSSEKYMIDHSRFAPYMTTWLPLSKEKMTSFTIYFSPHQLKPKIWNTHEEKINRSGTVFDAQTGRRIPVLSDVIVSRKYYILTQERPSFSSKYFELGCLLSDGKWAVWSFTPLVLNDRSTDECFDKLKMHLTQHPVNIYPLWPPVQITDDVLETTATDIWILCMGDADFNVFPRTQQSVLEALQIDKSHHILHINNNGSLQMVCAERYSHKLNYLYIHQSNPAGEGKDASVLIRDRAGTKLIPGILEEMPEDNEIYFSSLYDGTVIVERNGSLLYEAQLKGGTEIRLINFQYEDVITVRVGGEIKASLQMPQMKISHFDSLPVYNKQWSMRPVPFPRRYAWILNKIPPESKLYTSVLSALEAGKIPEDGFKELYQICGGFVK